MMGRHGEHTATASAGRYLALAVIAVIGVTTTIGCRSLQGPGEESRPTIRVRNGSVDITVDAGDFQPSGDEWYSDAPGVAPNQFEVTLTGTSCDGTHVTTQPVVLVTYALANSPRREAVSISLKNTGAGNQAFVTPVPGAAMKPRPGRLGLRVGQPWAVHEVTVGNGAACTMTSNLPEIDIDQIP